MDKKTKKVLVCDDDQGIAELIKVILEENKFEVKLMFNGKGILKKVKEFMPNLILLDLWMPGLKGQEVIRIIKTEQQNKNIPIIVFSALNEAEKEAKNSGADGFVLKPFDINHLMKIINKFIAS